MLLWLDDSTLNSGLSPDDENAAFEFLAGARRLGAHAVTASRPVAAALAKRSELSSNARAEYRAIHAGVAVEQAAARALGHGVVVHGAEDPSTRGTPAGFKRVSISRFVDGRAARTPVILGENLHDARVYREFARGLCNRDYRQFVVAADLRGGGGSTTADVYVAAVELERVFCLCIVDSDRHAEDAALGDTAARVSRAFEQQSADAVGYVHILACRTIEHLLPPSLVRAVAQVRDAGAVDTLALVEHLVGSDTWIPCADLKRGLRGRSIFETGSSSVPHLQPLLKALEELERIPASWMSCAAAGTCERDPCECVLLPGYGPTFVARCGQHLEEQTHQKCGELIARAHLDEFRQIAVLGVAWGCAFAKRRA